MNKPTAIITRFRKSFMSEDNLPNDNASIFVPPKTSTKEVITDTGLEYDLDITTDAQYIAKIFQTNSYEHNKESLLEYYSDICYIMDSKELGDKRNVGTIMGMTALGAFGVVAMGVSFVGGVAGVVFGGALGRIIANKISERRSRKKKEKVTQEDLYKVKLRCMLQLIKTHKQQSKNNLNRYRLIIEKVMEESSPALETSIFVGQKTIDNILLQLRKALFDERAQKAVLLSYKLFKAFLVQNDMNNRANLEIAARKLNTIFIPYARFVELDQKAFTQAVQDSSLVTYYKIKALLANPEINEILEQFPDYKMTPEALENFKTFIRQEVDTTAHIRKAVSTQSNQPEAGADNIRKSASLAENSDASQHLDRSLYKSEPSLRDMHMSEFEEDVNARKTEAYYVDFSRVQSIKPTESAISGHMGPKMTTSKLADISLTQSRVQRRPLTTENDKSEKAEQEKEEKEHKKNDSYKQLDIDNSQLVKVGSPEISLTRQDDPPAGFELVRSQSRKEKNEVKEAMAESLAKKSLLEEGADLSKMSPVNKVIFDRVLSIAYDEVTKWDRVITSPTIRIDKVRPEGSPVVLIRAWAFIEGYSPKEVFDQIYDSENRTKWDTVTTNLSVVDQLDENTAVIHFVVKAPMGIADRDFVQKRNYQLDYPEKGTITMSFQSFAHPKMPPHKNRIRGETHIAGYVIKPSTKAPNSTDLGILTQVDIKGSIPKMIVNMVAGKAPAEWVTKLVKACERTRMENQKKAL